MLGFSKVPIFLCHSVFIVLAMEVTYGVVSYREDEGFGVGGATVQKFSGQMLNEVADR